MIGCCTDHWRSYHDGNETIPVIQISNRSRFKSVCHKTIIFSVEIQPWANTSRGCPTIRAQYAFAENVCCLTTLLFDFIIFAILLTNCTANQMWIAHLKTSREEGAGHKLVILLHFSLHSVSEICEFAQDKRDNRLLLPSDFKSLKSNNQSLSTLKAKGINFGKQ